MLQANTTQAVAPTATLQRSPSSGVRDNLEFGGLSAPLTLSAWFVQLELEYLPVLKKVVVRGVNGEFPTERG
jgi:hypothetical protein